MQHNTTQLAFWKNLGKGGQGGETAIILIQFNTKKKVDIVPVYKLIKIIGLFYFKNFIFNPTFISKSLHTSPQTC